MGTANRPAPLAPNFEFNRLLALPIALDAVDIAVPTGPPMIPPILDAKGAALETTSNPFFNTGNALPINVFAPLTIFLNQLPNAILFVFALKNSISMKRMKGLTY